MPVPVNQVTFKEPNEFAKRPAKPDDLIQVSKDHVVELSSIVQLAQSPIYITSLNLGTFAALTNLIEFAKIETSPSVTQFFVSHVYNGYKDATGNKLWGLELGTVRIESDGNITTLDNMAECLIRVQPGHANYNGWQPSGSRLYVGIAGGIKYTLSLNFDSLNLHWAQGSITHYQYSESLLSPLCYDVATSGFGFTAMAVSQQFFTQALNDYNVNAFKPSFEGTLPGAARQVPISLRKKGLRLHFRLKLTFKGHAMTPLVVSTASMYMGELGIGWEDPENWQGLTPIILSEAQYENLDPIPINTLFYIKET